MFIENIKNTHIALMLSDLEEKNGIAVKGVIVDCQYDIGSGINGTISDSLSVEFIVELKEKDLCLKSKGYLDNMATARDEDNGIIYVHHVSQDEIFNVEVV